MAVAICPSTLEGGVTPTCGSCGIALCFDISEEEYREQKGFWDNWQCGHCNPNARGAQKRWLMERGKLMFSEIAKKKIEEQLRKGHPAGTLPGIFIGKTRKVLYQLMSQSGQAEESGGVEAFGGCVSVTEDIKRGVINLFALALSFGIDLEKAFEGESTSASTPAVGETATAKTETSAADDSKPSGTAAGGEATLSDGNGKETQKDMIADAMKAAGSLDALNKVWKEIALDKSLQPMAKVALQKVYQQRKKELAAG